MPRSSRRYHVLTQSDNDIIVVGLKNHRTLKAIAAAIGCSRQSLAKYIHDVPLLQTLYTDMQEDLLDRAENMLYRKICDGDVKATIFVLERYGRDRGWGKLPPRRVTEEEAEQIIIGTIPEVEVGQ